MCSQVVSQTQVIQVTPRILHNRSQIPSGANLCTRPCKGPGAALQFTAGVKQRNRHFASSRFRSCSSSCCNAGLWRSGIIAAHSGTSFGTNLLHLHLPLHPWWVFTALAYLLGGWDARARCTGRSVDDLACCGECRSRSPFFLIIIVETSDDVTRKSPVIVIAPLMVHLGRNVHHPIAPRSLVTSTAVL